MVTGIILLPVECTIVVGRKELARVAPIKCYAGGSDIASSLFIVKR